MNQIVDDSVERDVGQARITYGRSDALELLLMQFFYCQMLVRSVSPSGFPHLFMQTFCTSLRQSVGKGLIHHLVVFILLEVLLCLHLGGSGKYTNAVLLERGLRTNEITQAQAETVFPWHLLTKHGQAYGISVGMR